MRDIHTLAVSLYRSSCQLVAYKIFLCANVCFAPIRLLSVKGTWMVNWTDN